MGTKFTQTPRSSPGCNKQIMGMRFKSSSSQRFYFENNKNLVQLILMRWSVCIKKVDILFYQDQLHAVLVESDSLVLSNRQFGQVVLIMVYQYLLLAQCATSPSLGRVGGLGYGLGPGWCLRSYRYEL